MLKPSFRSLVRNWWMVAVWLGVIRMESTDMASAHNTSFVLYKVLSIVAPHVRVESVELLNAILRKTGHFLGYGILSALVFLLCEIPIAIGCVRCCSGPGEFICGIGGAGSG